MTEPAPLSDDALHVTLLRPPTGEHHTARQWTGAAATLFTTTGAPITDPVPYQVVGGPGTGKTSLLIDLACASCRQPEHSTDAVLLLTQSKRAAATLSEEVATPTACLPALLQRKVHQLRNSSPAQKKM